MLHFGLSDPQVQLLYIIYNYAQKAVSDLEEEKNYVRPTTKFIEGTTKLRRAGRNYRYSEIAKHRDSGSGGGRRRRWVLDIICLIKFRLSSLPPPTIGNSECRLLSEEAESKQTVGPDQLVFTLCLSRRGKAYPKRANHGSLISQLLCARTSSPWMVIALL